MVGLLVTLSDRVRRAGPGRRESRDAGWTLIELLVVLSIIMILTSIGLVLYRNSVQSAKEAALRSNLFIMREAIDQHYADRGEYPDSLDALVSMSYLRAIPLDPITDSTTTWQTIPAPAEPGSLRTTAGIYDVKSGAQGTALDGTAYSDW